MRSLGGILAGIMFFIGFITAVVTSPNFNKKAPQTRVEARTKQISLDMLLDAIEHVESGGNPNAIGRDGEVGAYQIRKIYVDDVNRLLKIAGCNASFGYLDRYDTHASREMCHIYITHYATKERIGRKPTFEDMSRIHNGGPNGWKKESTKPYWEKVKKCLEIEI